MIKEIKEYCKACVKCAINRKTSPRTFLHPLEITDASFAVIGIDVLGPIRPHSIQRNNNIMSLRIT